MFEAMLRGGSQDGRPGCVAEAGGQSVDRGRRRCVEDGSGRADMIRQDVSFQIVATGRSLLLNGRKGLRLREWPRASIACLILPWAARHYPADDTSISSAYEAFTTVRHIVARHGIDTGVLDASNDIFRRALDAGYGADGLARPVPMRSLPGGAARAGPR